MSHNGNQFPWALRCGIIACIGYVLRLALACQANDLKKIQITLLAGVAQSVEQRTRNAKAVGSIPISGTINMPKKTTNRHIG